MSDYFSDQIAKGEPIIPPIPQGVPQATVVEAGAWQGLPVRAGNDRVFILKQGKKHWVTSPEALAKLGYALGDEVKIDQATLDVLEDGDPIR